MHLAATHAKITVQRAAGEETLLDMPCMFSEQRTYPLPRDGMAPNVVVIPRRSPDHHLQLRR